MEMNRSETALGEGNADAPVSRELNEEALEQIRAIIEAQKRHTKPGVAPKSNILRSVIDPLIRILNHTRNLLSGIVGTTSGDEKLEPAETPLDILFRVIPSVDTGAGLQRLLRLNGFEKFNGKITLNYDTIDVIAVNTGGFMRVFVGKRRSDGRLVVVKILKKERFEDDICAERTMRERHFFEERDREDPVKYWPEFLDEGRIEHPDSPSNKIDCSVLEFIPGITLATVIEKYPEVASNPDFVLAVAMQLAHALEFFYEKGYVIRDLKPENILIVKPESGKPFVRLIDANCIKVPYWLLTEPGKVVGTPTYMAPEVAVDDFLAQDTDLYNVGLIMYEMLNRGVRPFQGESAMRLMMAHVEEDPPPIDGLPLSLSVLVDMFLSKNPCDRPKSGKSAREVITRFYDILCRNSLLTKHIGPAYTSI